MIGGGGSPGPRGTARERALHAVEYYNNTLLRARVGAGLTTSRHQEALYRSNSSLELVGSPPPPALREYGSQGSLDVLGSESFFAMLQDYRPQVLGLADQRSPGPAEYLRSRVEPPPATENASNALAAVTSADDSSTISGPSSSTSPKLKLKIHKFWGVSSGNKPPRLVDDSVALSVANAEMEERQRRRAFAHYDCQSLTANLGYAAKLRGLLLARRRNTTTGASAASMLGTRAATPDGPDLGDEDLGDGRGNELLEACPFFRNELGGEEERIVSLTRGQQQQQRYTAVHKPAMACGVSVLEFPPGETHWTHGTCPYQRIPGRSIESVDEGALYYRRYFFNQDHQNWFGMDDNLGPVAVSIKREKMDKSSDQSSSDHSAQYQYRLIIRTSELLTLRGSILEDAIPNFKSCNNKTLNAKEVLEYVAPEIQSSCLRLGISSPQTEDQLIKLDEQGLTTTYKVGVMYCKVGQSSEEEMYNNEESGPALLEFLDTIGQRVRLRGFDKYKAGLDNKTDSTGLYSVYAQHQQYEIMFHVSTLLPFTPNNRQQLLRKRHVGNDIVTIVFQEPGAHPFTPKNIRSQFQHVFIIVRVHNPCSDNTEYSVAVSRSKEVPVFGPPIHESATFPKSKSFAEFLLAKVINAENAAHRSEKFATMATRTRQEYLKDLASNYITSTVIDTNQKFSIMSFSTRKKERSRPRFVLDASQRGAICWQVILDDSGQSLRVECFLGVSTDTLVLIEERSREIVFVMPCKAILGWTIQTNSLRLYHHQGECTTVHMREGPERDELMELVARLQAVTNGCLAQELVLRRNNMGQLGFHVQPDGVVTQVEMLDPAWQAGLRKGFRLVEICKVAVSTLSHDQMVDLLKTASIVTVTVIPAFSDGSPRRGCTLQNCKYTLCSFEGDYENLEEKSACKPVIQQAVPGNHRRRYDRSFSPPRSSNSSGYGTASSNKSFNVPDSRFPSNPEGTMTSSSSDERWYDILESEVPVQESPPPPLPARLGSANNSAFQQVSPKAKVQLSHSVPLMHGNFSIPSNSRSSADYARTNKNNDNYSHYNETKPILSNQLDCMAGSRNGIVVVSDGHSTDTSSASERLFGAASEDELSTGSGNVSPKMRHSRKKPAGSVTPSSQGSRNQSPRSVTSNTNKDMGEARLRPGVTPRSNRNSANLTSSTLQEDLMKLINPEYLTDRDNNTSSPSVKESHMNGCTVSGKVHSSGDSSRSRSRENLSVTGSGSNLSVTPQGNGEHTTEVILTMARPATVISNASTASSPAPSENKLLTKEERLSPRVTKCPGNATKPLLLPDSREMDWPSLVDTATRALQQGEQSAATRNGEAALACWTGDVAERLGLDTSTSSGSGRRVTELQTHLARETRRRLSLEDEVRRLRDENRRLQEESQAAAQQLRRFTEWFFQTIDRQ